MSYESKKKILLIIDEYGWAFDNITKMIMKYNEKYIINVITHNEFKKDVILNINHCVFFWYDEKNLRILDSISKNKDIKISLCLYDYSKWVNNTTKTYKSYMDKFVNKIDYLLYSCEHILNIFDETYIKKNIIKYPIYDGVDTNLFKFQNYNDDIYTKPILNIGWIGNSNKLIHGINKGFDSIKGTINSMSDKFAFIPQDSNRGKSIKHEDIPSYIKNIDIIVCFSLYEGTPNQILEASSSGRCWVSTNVGIISELNKDKKCGVVIEREIESLKQSLLYLYENRELIVKYGLNGRNVTENNWDWKVRTEQFFKVFEF